MMSGSASWMMRRTSARVSARQPPRNRIRSSMRREAAFPVARFASAPGSAFAPAFDGDLDLVADLRGLLARDVPLALGFAMFSVIKYPRTTHREADVSVHQSMFRCLFGKAVIANGYDRATPSECPERICRIPAF